MTEAVAQVLSFLTIFTPLGAIIDYIMYRDHKCSIKEFNAKTCELEAFKKLLPKEKAKLEQLNLEKKESKDNKHFRVAPVDDTKKLKVLDNYSDFYYILGYYLDTYYKALQNGTLETLLQQNGYSQESISIMTNYVKENGHVLARRKTTKLQKNTEV